MPAGVSWPRYLSFFTASMISMFAGSQTVHYYYRPLEDLNELIEKELAKRNKEAKELERLKKEEKGPSDVNSSPSSPRPSQT